MICAINRKSERVFGVINPNKKAILAFMRSNDPNGFGEGRILDRVTGKTVEPYDNGYEVGELFYRDSDIYHFDKYDMELNPDFCKAALRMARGRGEAPILTVFSDTAVDDTITFDPDNPTKGISEKALSSFFQAHPEYK